jgi:rsbT co-antagonist protein RsbR
MTSDGQIIADLIEKNEANVLTEWVRDQLTNVSLRTNLLRESDLRQQSEELLGMILRALRESGFEDTGGPGWQGVRELLADISRSRARQGFSSSETALFVFSLKRPLFDRIDGSTDTTPADTTRLIRQLSLLLDDLGLKVMEFYQKGREEVIARQQQELLELSTPVVRLWDNILALPLIGTLDSARTQIVMESLLQEIVSTGAGIAIIDITGVPTVDTLVAQHLLKTVAAARLMGADCIISGIRPQIAQTIVHLGVELQDVVTKATLADAFMVALKRNGKIITSVGNGA